MLSRHDRGVVWDHIGIKQGIRDITRTTGSFFWLDLDFCAEGKTMIGNQVEKKMVNETEP